MERAIKLTKGKKVKSGKEREKAGHEERNEAEQRRVG